MSDKAARQQGKYGWARKMIEAFLAQSGTSAEDSWLPIECPDEFGRSQMQVYKTLFKAIRKDFYDDPVEVKLFSDWPNHVWLHRSDGDEA